MEIHGNRTTYCSDFFQGLGTLLVSVYKHFKIRELSNQTGENKY